MHICINEILAVFLLMDAWSSGIWRAWVLSARIRFRQRNTDKVVAVLDCHGGESDGI